MKNQPITICNATVHPGEVANLALPLPEQYSCSPLYMPIKVLNGTKKGPCVLIFSILEGVELNGLEIVNRITNDIDVDQLSGTLIAIPAVNVYGLTHHPRILPSGQNFTACFPGKEKGNFGERMAYVFTEQILKKANYCIELDTGGKNHNILPQLYCSLKNRQAKELARTFGAPVITDVHVEDNTLRQVTEDLQIPLLVYQAGEAMRFDENSIALGIAGIKNIMGSLQMMDHQSEHKQASIFSQNEKWVVAHVGGILHTDISLGQTVKKGDLLGNISDPFGAPITTPIKSPFDGIIVGVNTEPLVYEGLEIFKISSFLDNDRAESVIEKWDQEQPDSYINN